MTQSEIRSSTQPVTAVTPSTEALHLSADGRRGADDAPVSSTQPVSTAERSAATLPLPGWLATALAVVAVGTLVVLPFALAAGGLNLTEAVDGYSYRPRPCSPSSGP